MMPADLFAATPDNACPAYLNFRRADNDDCRAGRQHCEDLWTDFESLADANFITEFPIHLHERWFEMYLAVALKRAGLNVQCPKRGPDILLTSGNSRIWIEATCPTAGDVGRPDSVPKPQYAGAEKTPTATDTPRNSMSLRISNALTTKAKAFAGYLAKNIVASSDALVIAINVHAIPHAWADMNDLMLRSLYGIGDLVLTIDRNTGAVVDRAHERLATIAKKSTGQPVGIQPFVDESMPHISAVLSSGEDAVNRPPRLGDGFKLYPNLTATRPWPAGAIPLGEEWTHEPEAAGGASQITKVSHIPVV